MVCTGISLFQHANLQSETTVHNQHFIVDQPTQAKALLELPASYTNVQPVIESKKDVSFPRADYSLQSECHIFNQALQKEFG